VGDMRTGPKEPTGAVQRLVLNHLRSATGAARDFGTSVDQLLAALGADLKPAKPHHKKSSIGDALQALLSAGWVSHEGGSYRLIA
jgi:hypothetical protein